jgi:hypothetical protein
MKLQDEIARVAYDLYLKRGCVHGYDCEDWLEAEKIVMSGRAETGTAPAGSEKPKRGRKPSVKSQEKEEKPVRSKAKTTRTPRKKKTE